MNEYCITKKINRRMVMKTTIKQAKDHLNQDVTIGAWLTNKRSSGKIAFYNYVMEQALCKA